MYLSGKGFLDIVSETKDLNGITKFSEYLTERCSSIEDKS